MGKNSLRYLEEVVQSGLTSDMVSRFEKAFAKKLGVKHCIATPGCTPALAVLAASLGLQPGDEVIVSPVTDYGTIQGLVSENLIPVFADTAPGTVNVSAETIEPLISDRTKGILVVHMTGIICDMDSINELAERHGLFVYEDACQAIMGRYKGRLAGTLADAAAFSFDAEKTMGWDVGGCVVTNDDELAERMRFIGQSRGAVQEEHFGTRHVEPGYAYRMTQCTAAISLAQLEEVDRWVEQRDRMARLLSELVSEIPGVTPLPIPDYLDVYSCWMFSLSIDPEMFRCSPEEFAAQMERAGIPGAGLGKYYLMPEACTFLKRKAEGGVYPYSIPPASHRYSYGADVCPTARDFLKTWIRWSTFSEKYTEADCERAAQIVEEVAESNRR